MTVPPFHLMFLKSKAHLVVALIALSFASCSNPDPNSQIDEGLISENTYLSQEIGWSMIMPDGWDFLSRKQIDFYENKGADVLSETAGGEISYEGLKNLLHFKKDRFNIFQSTSEPFALEYEGEWEENNEALKQLVLQTYTDQGIHSKVTETSEEEIDGVLFETYTFTLFAPDGEVIIRQIMYSTLRNGYDFGVNITYNTDESRDVMLKAWRESTFEN